MKPRGNVQQARAANRLRDISSLFAAFASCSARARAQVVMGRYCAHTDISAFLSEEWAPRQYHGDHGTCEADAGFRRFPAFSRLADSLMHRECGQPIPRSINLSRVRLATMAKQPATKWTDTTSNWIREFSGRPWGPPPKKHPGTDGRGVSFHVAIIRETAPGASLPSDRS